MNRKANWFLLLVVAFAITLFATLPVEAFAALSPRNALGLASFIAVGMLAEVMAIDFGTGKPARSSLAFLPFLTATAVFSPAVAAAGAALVTAFSSLALSRQSLLKASFNVSQAVIAVGLAGAVYQLFLPDGAGQAVNTSVDYPGYIVLACVFFGTNILLASSAIALIKEQPFISVLRQVIGRKAGNVVYDLFASPIALVPAIMYLDYFVLGIIVVLLPLLLIRYSYLSKLQLEEANRDLLKVLIKAIETRDPYTSGHSVRVATLARMIAEDLHLPARKISEVETAALLHDIGKIDSVYEAVIRKPYDLSDEERNLIKTHATRGADLLQSLSSVSSEVVRGVRHHHERHDGSGYPAGLRDHDIPISAKIIMMCDSVDAMLSDRPYRRALSISKVRAELIRCSGTQFDPAIVQLLLSQNTLERAADLVDRPQADLQVIRLTESA